MTKTYYSNAYLREIIAEEIFAGKWS